ncbi:hypothetical protein ACFTRD_04190 [Paenibacillus sp. NPDC056933]|uniref:hypothetical protein n=1 Tax=Paenibacillus sp. NPDC056933 TaxID=3345968 RepID=UPI0036386CD5
MIIILASKGKSNWISGIFQAEEVAVQYMELIPEGLKVHQNLIHVEDLKYPFYIIESQGDFQFLTKDEVIALFNNTDVSEDEDEVLFNIYMIDSDYRPKKPGTDYMGILHHDHVTNEFIEKYKEEGTEILVKRRIF